jgi:hypothetical protein
VACEGEKDAFRHRRVKKPKRISSPVFIELP